MANCEGARLSNSLEIGALVFLYGDDSVSAIQATTLFARGSRKPDGSITGFQK